MRLRALLVVLLCLVTPVRAEEILFPPVGGGGVVTTIPFPISIGGTGQDGTSFVAGNCVEVAANGLSLTDAGAPCGSGGGGSSIILDLGDDGGNDSTALGEIAIVNDTNGIFAESAADKLQIDVADDWPQCDLADDLACVGCVDATELASGVGVPVAGTYVDVAGQTVSVDTTEMNDLTVGDNTEAAIRWTFDPSGTVNPYVEWASGQTTLGGGSVLVDLPVGATFDVLDGDGDGVRYNPGTNLFAAVGAGINQANDVVCTGCVAFATDVTGTLPLANGGTNATSWTAGRCVQVNAGGTALESAAAACGAGGGGGDVTDVGPGCATGACLTDGVATTGTTLAVWEGTAVDANEFILAVPSANPGADVTVTLPSTTGTIASLDAAQFWNAGQTFQAGATFIGATGTQWEDASGNAALEWNPAGAGILAALGTGTNRANDVACGSACIDVSSETNLSASGGVTLTGDALTATLGTSVDLAAEVTGTLPVANGGTGTASTLTGLVRGGASAMTAAELSGDVVTSGSNATVIQANAVALTADTAGDYVATLTQGTGVAITGGSTGEGSTPTIGLDYAFSLAGNPGLTAGQCAFSSTGNGLLCEGVTPDAIETLLAFTDPTSTDKTINVPDANGTMAVSATTPLSVSAAGDISIANADDDGTTKGGASFADVDFDATSGNVTIAAAIARDSELPAVPTPVATPGGDPALAAGQCAFGITGVICEGAGADTFETTLRPVTLTADRTYTLPDVTGTLITTGDVGTVTGAMLTDLYAGSDVEGGSALTGDSATAFFSTGTIEAARLPEADDDGATKGIATFANADFDATAGVVTLDSSVSHLGQTIEPSELAQPFTMLSGNTIDGNSGSNAASWLLPRKTDCSAVSSEGGKCWDSDDDVDYTGNGSTADAAVMVHGKQAITGPIAIYNKDWPTVTPTPTPTATPTAATPTATAVTPTPTATRTPELATNYVALDTITLLGRLISRSATSSSSTTSPCLAADLSNTCHLYSTDTSSFGGNHVITTDRTQASIANANGITFGCALPFGGNINACFESPNGSATLKFSTAPATSSAAATVASTATETTLIGTITNGSLTLPANYWRLGKVVRVTVTGTWGGSGLRTLNLRVKAGSTTLCSTGDETPPTITAGRFFKLEAFIQARSAVGASANMQCNGLVTFMPAGTSLAEVNWELDGTAQTVALATNASQALSVTADWGASADSTDTITGDIVAIEALN